ncbi:response regulator [Zoogloea sp.]|jgi:two-component system KDP operon response regulator KdpE|uniref:response regulator n=1 Tax=Zoogloea sp. TaxID=49181 RepID=UPI001AC1DE6B|nr:response regulator [Zoogloea sp.]MBN8282311.1 response regulator [Zoogloea sp.]
MKGATILLIEDERQIRRFVRSALEKEGLRVSEAETRREGLVEAGRCQPELVILDLGLPDGDGVGFVDDFRAWSVAPVLVLSARSTEYDKIGVLDAGADDYLTKPFSVGELLARVRALLRRGRARPGTEAARVSFGDVEVDFSLRQVLRRGEAVRLTPLEYRLLAVLVANAGKVMTHRQLLHEVWGQATGDNSHYLRIYVGHLRHKLEDDPAQPRHFLTETGVGYRFHL